MPSAPRSQRNRLGCTARALENVAPWCLRHIEQWQCPMNSKGASASKATSPHRQVPRTVMLRPPLPPRVRRLGRVALGRSQRNGLRVTRTHPLAEHALEFPPRTPLARECRAALFSGVPVKRVNMPVSVGPGATPFTRIPDLAVSSATDLVMPSTACLLPT